MRTSDLSEILSPEMRASIIEKTGSETPNPQGICCTNCGASEVYADPNSPKDIGKWAWIIRAFRVDDASECKNCKSWFRM